jgi:hypothetical protein
MVRIHQFPPKPVNAGFFVLQRFQGFQAIKDGRFHFRQISGKKQKISKMSTFVV